MVEISTGNREDALDIVQDAMLKLAERYPDRPEREWGPLFHRVLQSRIIDWHRRNAVRRRWRIWFRPDDDIQEDPLENQPERASVEPDQQTMRARFADDLESALHRLPTRQQQAFLLRVWEGMDSAAAARAMGCSEGSVKTHLHRAMHALRGYLKDYVEA